MTENRSALKHLQSVAKRMETFEAGPTVAKTGTGARREGRGFERLVSEFWSAAGGLAQATGATSELVTDGSRARWRRWALGPRELFLPAGDDSSRHARRVEQPAWFSTEFKVEELVQTYPGVAEASRRWAPRSGPYKAERYPGLFRGLTTRFDDTIVLAQHRTLEEKVLLEYKTAKSTAKDRIDGNAHERLSFQVLQYLEVAPRYPRCSLEVLANGAFVRYRNKYHVNFHVQAERLTAFAWFAMSHRCTADAVADLAIGLIDWLATGSDRRNGSPA